MSHHVFGDELEVGLISALGELAFIRGHVQDLRLATARFDLRELAAHLAALSALAVALAHELEGPRND
jgi:hypothetical protein